MNKKEDYREANQEEIDYFYEIRKEKFKKITIEVENEQK
jgi:hypothetical protein